MTSRCVLAFVVALAAGCGGDAAIPDDATEIAPSATDSGGASLPSTSGLPVPEPPVDSSRLTWTAPDAWTEERPSSQMRQAQYRLPGPAGDGELYVFYFGPGQGGDAMANAERWIGQFRGPDGGELGEDAVVLHDRSGEAIPKLVVEARGTFVGGGMPGGPPQPPQPGHMLLGAVVQGPDANWFFKAIGPEATIDSHRENFDALLASIR